MPTTEGGEQAATCRLAGRSARLFRGAGGTKSDRSADANANLYAEVGKLVRFRSGGKRVRRENIVTERGIGHMFSPLMDHSNPRADLISSAEVEVHFDKVLPAASANSLV
jgi:hypothetical protein